ncbi:MAG TPA: glycerol-3-phosphate dehydrogenase [Polyangiaceae bacterium]
MFKPGLSVVGGGAWGLGLAAAAARVGTPVLVQSRRTLSSLPNGVRQAKDVKEIAEHSRLILLAVPSAVLADVARSLGDVIDGRHLVVHGIRGLAHAVKEGGDDVIPLTEIVRRETPARRVGALGGPVLSEDLLAGRPCLLVCGSHFPEVNRAVTAAFSGPSLRVYTSPDLVGVEWASALVGCLAIGIGYAHGSNVSPGLVAALISRGVGEAARIAASAGGEERTLLGLAGYGDLLASIEQEDRPEVRFGKALAAGKSIEEASHAANERIEAVELLPRIAEWNKAHGVVAPIFSALADGVLARRPPHAIVDDLMATPAQSL